MFKYDETMLIEEVVLKNYLDKSYAGVVTIIDVEDKDFSGNKNIILTVQPEGYEPVKLYIMYESARGADMSFNTKKLVQLCSILGLKPEELTTKAKGKKVGMFLRAKLSQDQRFINFNLDGVYYPKTNKTTTETMQKKTAETFKRMTALYEKQPKLERKKDNVTKTTATTAIDNTDIDEEFPF